MQEAGAEQTYREGWAPGRSVQRFLAWWAGPKPIGVFLSLLIAAIIIPALGISAVLIKRNDLAQREIAATLAAGMAASIAEAVDRELNGVMTTLRIMASSPTLLEQDMPNFYKRATDALKGTNSHLALVDNRFNQLLNTLVPYGTALWPPGNPHLAEAALASRATSISDIFFGPVSRKWVFDVILPVFLPNQEPKLLILTQEVNSLTSTLSQHRLRGGWNATLLDRENRVAASTAGTDLVGRPFFISIDGGRSMQLATSTNPRDKETYLIVTDESNFSGWRVVVWAPVSVIEAPMRKTLLLLLGGSVIVIAIATITAWLVGRQITRPMRELAADARRVGSGETVMAHVYPVAEMTTVSSALAEAARNRKHAENEIRLLMREVAHRAKNQLTVVSSMAKQNARHARSLPSFLDSFQKRLYGLARSTDLLIAGGAAGVELRELITVQVEPFRPEEAERLSLDGPTFRLANQAAQTIGLAIHELATNASKYGAFSSAGGSVHVSWTMDGERLVFIWREQVNRPRRKPVNRRGFGTEIIERMLGGSFEAEIERNFHPNGLECIFRIPVARIAPEHVIAQTAVAE